MNEGHGEISKRDTPILKMEILLSLKYHLALKIANQLLWLDCRMALGLAQRNSMSFALIMSIPSTGYSSSNQTISYLNVLGLSMA